MAHTGYLPWDKFSKGIRSNLSKVHKWLEIKEIDGRKTYKLTNVNP